MIGACGSGSCDPNGQLPPIIQAFFLDCAWAVQRMSTGDGNKGGMILLIALGSVLTPY